VRTEAIEEFLVFARHQSFSRAAEELHISQPSLSKHMADLEREIGVELIDRRTRGKNRPVLSQAGKYFYEEASYLATNFQGILEHCRAIGRSSMRDIRIQELWQNNAMFELYSIAGVYQSTHAQDDVRYVRLSEKPPVDALLDNEFDVVFDVWCGSYADRVSQLSELKVKAVPFLTEPLVIWYQDRNPHIKHESGLRLEDLLDIPVIMTRGSSHDYMAVAYAAYCERQGLFPRLRHMQPRDNTPTGMFMSDFQDGVLMTSPAMVQDPRLRSRSDLKFSTVDDERILVAFLLAVRADDRVACSFMDYVVQHRRTK
jgi:DNA-binding transcriptional LysR family regulator